MTLAASPPDTVGPTTFAKAASGRRGRAITLRYKATDALSPRLLATRVLVKNSRGAVVNRYSLGKRTSARWYSLRWTPKARGTYRYYVYAKDLAGNVQSRVGSARVVVR